MQKDDRFAEGQLPQTEKKPSKKPWRRIIAAAMAVILLFSLVLGWAIQIRFAQLSYLGTVLEHAAAVTAENTGYLSEGALQRAWNILRYAVGKPKTYDDYEMYTSLAIARTEYSEAIPYMRGCIDLYDGDSAREKAVLQMRLGSLYALSEDNENAITAFDQAVQTDPTLADAYLLRAQMYSLGGQMDKAAEDIGKYDALAGNNPAIRAAIGGLYESAGDYENAAKCYTLGLEQSNGTDTELLSARARCYILLQNMAGAKADLIRFFAEGGTDPTGEYNLMLGLCRMEADEFDRALQSFHNAVNAGYPHRALIFSQCVLCAYIVGDYDTVISDGEQALAALKEDLTSGVQILPGMEEELMTEEELHHWIGLAKMAKEDFSGAKTEFLAIGDTETAMAGIFYYLGLCSASLGENEEAVTFYGRSIEKEEMVSLCYYNRGVSYLQLEMLEEGLTDLITVLQRADDADASAAAAQLLSDLGVEVVFEDQEA